MKYHKIIPVVIIGTILLVASIVSTYIVTTLFEEVRERRVSVDLVCRDYCVTNDFKNGMWIRQSERGCGLKCGCFDVHTIYGDEDNYIHRDYGKTVCLDYIGEK